MIPEYVAYIAARRQEEWNAMSARPNAPVRSDDPDQVAFHPFAALRAWLSTDLRRLADRLDPASQRSYGAPLAHRR